MRIVMSAVLVLILAAAIWVFFAGRGGPAPSKPGSPPTVPQVPPQNTSPPTPSAPPPASPSEQPPSETSRNTPEPHATWDDVEREILEITNQERAAAHLKPVAAEDTLRLTARAQSADMIARHFAQHINPSGESPADRIMKFHRRLIGEAGENIWEASGQTYAANPKLAAVIMDTWMHSPHHRANILNPNYTHLGVGVIIQGNEVRATQNFGQVRAYLNSPLPERLPRGASVDLTLQGAPPAAEMFALSLVTDWKPVFGPLPLSNARFDTKPGIYQLHVYFPDGKGQYTIFDGPRVTIE
jgi:uncharacterized protein YkwD